MDANTTETTMATKTTCTAAGCSTRTGHVCRPRMTVPPKSCPDCEGDGRRWNAAADRFDDVTCPTCKGTGNDPRDPKSRAR